MGRRKDESFEPSKSREKRGPKSRANESREVTISKACSYILRHGAEKEGLSMRADGFIKVTDLLARPKIAKLECDSDTLRAIVASNDKQRFTLLFEPEGTGRDPEQQATASTTTTTIESISEPSSSGSINGTWWIRANQGHSLKVEELELTPVTSAAEIPIAVHGTDMSAWNHIKNEGLSKMARNHIHMAKGLSDDQTVISGMRKNSTVFIYVNAEAAMAEGILFSTSANGVILSPGNDKGFIPPHLFQRVIGRISGQMKRWDGDKWVAEPDASS
ncbi:hypothetical protein FRC01_012767 [Tulasnella sp. 417]|nr:hypothetical protein FRC01_012767 [Tulasnella sp. 417]